MQQNLTEITNFLKGFRNWFFLKKKVGTFSEKISFFKKPLEVANMLRNSNESINFLRAFIIVFKKKVLCNNFLNFFEPLKFKPRKFAIESHWVSKKPRNVRILVFFEEKMRFSKQSPAFFQTSLERPNLLQNATETKKFRKVVNVCVSD